MEIRPQRTIDAGLALFTMPFVADYSPQEDEGDNDEYWT